MGLLPVCGEALCAAELADRRASARRLAEARLVEIRVVQVQLQRLVVQLDQLPQCDPSRIRLGTDAMPHRVAQTKRGTTAERCGTRGSRATRFAHGAAGVRWRVDMKMEALVIVGVSGRAHVGRPVLYTPAYRKQNVA